MLLKVSTAMIFAVATSEPGPSLRDPRPSQFNEHMTYMKPAELHRALDGDKVDVFWNLSPIYLEKYGDLLGKFGVYHCSVGFLNRRTGLNMTLEFVGDTAEPIWNPSRFTPRLDKNARTMQWSSPSVILPKEGILDLVYWQVRTRVATIDHETYNGLLDWLPGIMEQPEFSRYFLFNLAVSHPWQVQFHSMTCYDFAGAVLTKISDLAGGCVFDQTLPGVWMDDIYFLATAPARETKDIDAVYDFYEALEGVKDLESGDVFKFVHQVGRLVDLAKDGTAIYPDAMGNYWKFKVAFPGALLSQKHAPLPKCETVVV